jgi:hypothetical protein
MFTVCGCKLFSTYMTLQPRRPIPTPIQTGLDMLLVIRFADCYCTAGLQCETIPVMGKPVAISSVRLLEMVKNYCST